MNHYCDIWFWRASDQEAVARHLNFRAAADELAAVAVGG